MHTNHVEKIKIKASRIKRIEIRAEIRERENRPTIEKITQVNHLFFERNKTTDNP